ncbi:MAG TPA: fasciclin domain-containing protein [Bryobacteraceae bacterium]|nr:fasciclin domain-containing protein [Bryobacteraceae bacterium]
MSYQEQTTTDQTVADTRDERLATHSIADTLAGDPDLSRFNEALRRTGIDRILQDGEWITVLAPSNQALGAGEPDVQHYLSQGAKTLDDIRRAGTLRMRDGSELPVRIEGTDVRVGGARITRPDIECTNGVIHVIEGSL